MVRITINAAFIPYFWSESNNLGFFCIYAT